MGFSSLIDILGSTIVGALLLLILLRMNDTATQNTYVYAGEAQVQQNLVSAVALIEYDFRKIGYCKDYTQIPDPSKAILQADSNSIKFLTDVYDAASNGGDGKVDTMYYYLGPTSELSGSSNPRDRILYRVINSAQPKGSNLGITQFTIAYYDALGQKIPFPITVPGEIYTMQIDVKVEATAVFQDNLEDKKLYASSFWRQIRLAARNIRNR